MSQNEILWSPSKERVEKANLTHFMSHLKSAHNLNVESYNELQKWSVEEPEAFWSELFHYYGIEYSGELTPVCEDFGFKSYGWFKNVKLNFAKNLLRFKDSKNTALNFVHESGLKKEISYNELYLQVASFQGKLKGMISKGDVLACYMPNIPETAISMLATSSLGGTFTSTSSDFGIEGVIDRFGQSKPKVLVAAAGYEYNGKYFDNLEKIKTIKNEIPSIEKVIIVDFLSKNVDASLVPDSVLWSDFQSDQKSVEFIDCEFSHPLYIMYSSGTTGKPKCIVHSQGGTLLQHVKEIGLHTNLTEDKNIFFFTTCGWMMWNWLISSLYFGSKITLYEGSPGYPSLGEYFSLIDREKINIFGTSPKFLRALEDNVGIPKGDFSTLETVISTGAPLLPEQFDYVYKIKNDLHLVSFSGGTDIIGCFVIGNPIGHVRRGEIQCLALGMDVDCFDDNAKSLRSKEGELVCKKSFPSRPIYFLDDKDNKRINDAYFNHFENTWHHGDFIQITEEGGVIVYGRSDATLNPGGVRIGTSEIYRQTETLSYIVDSICVGKQVDGDVEVYLFVKMNDVALDDDKIKEIKTLIRKNTTPRHVPKEVIQISDIPYTRSGKKMELAVTRLINGKELTNIEAVANPECLEEYKKY